MGIGTSLALLAIGAICAFALNFDVSGLEIRTIGYILMAVGALGLAISLAWMANARGREPAQPVVRERDVY